MTSTQRNTGSQNRSTATPRRDTAAQRLSRDATGAVAVAAAVLVMLAGHGYGAVAALGGCALYLLVKGRRGPVAGSGTTARQVLRAACWSAVAAVAVLVSQGFTATGGPALGVALAAALATALMLTAQRRRR